MTVNQREQGIVCLWFSKELQTRKCRKICRTLQGRAPNLSRNRGNKQDAQKIVDAIEKAKPVEEEPSPEKIARDDRFILVKSPYCIIGINE